MSHTSRSSQFAAGHNPVTDGTGSPAAARTLTLTRCRRRVEYRQYTTSKRFSRGGQSVAVRSAQ